LPVPRRKLSRNAGICTERPWLVPTIPKRIAVYSPARKFGFSARSMDSSEIDMLRKGGSM